MLKVTCAIIVEKNKILITRNGAESDHPFLWEFPGGKINKNETEHECIIREINEELNIQIKIIEKMHEVEWDYGFKKIHLIPFLCNMQSGKITLSEHIDSKWIEIDSLYEINFSGADKALLEIENNRQLLKKYLRENMNNS